MAFEFLNDLGKELVASRRQRQDAELAAAQNAITLSRQVETVNRQHQVATAPINANILQRAAAGEKARELVDSGKFSDRLELANLRITDPGNFNPAIRAQRNQTDASLLSIIAASKSDALATLQARLNTGQAGVDLAQIQENIALEQFNLSADMRNLVTGQLQAARGLREEVLANTSYEELRLATNVGLSMGSSTISINGVEIPLGEARSRVSDLEDRELVRAITATTRVTARISANRELRNAALLDVGQEKLQAALDASLGITASVNGDIFPVHEVQARLDELTGASDARNARNDHVRGLALAREIETFSERELLAIRNNNYVDPAGNSYPPELVDARYQRVRQAAADAAAAQVEQFELANQPMAAINQAARIFQDLGKSLPVSHPLRSVLSVTQAQLGQSQIQLGAGDAQGAMLQMQSAIENYQTAAEAAAKNDAFGDPELERLLTSFYITGQVNLLQFTQVASNRLVAGKTLNQLLPPALASAAQTAYTTIRNEMLQDFSINAIGSRPNVAERKQIDEAAASEAMIEVAHRSGVGIANFAIENQTEAASHPLFGRVTSQEFQNTIELSSAQAAATMAAQYNLTPQSLIEIIRTGVVPEELRGSIPDAETLDAELKFSEAMILQSQFSEFDVERMLQWQESQAGEFLNAVGNSIDPSVPGIAGLGAAALGVQGAQSAWQEYSATMAAANEARAQRTLDAANALVSPNDPLPFQALVLGSIKELSQEDRNLLWPVIARQIQVINTLNLQPSQKRQELARRVQALKFDDPAAQRALRLFSANWEEAEAQLKDIGSGIAFIRRGVSGALGSIPQANPAIPTLMLGSQSAVVQRSARSMEHYRLWLEQSQRPQPQQFQEHPKPFGPFQPGQQPQPFQPHQRMQRPQPMQSQPQ